MPFDTRFEKRHPVEAIVKFNVHESMSNSVKLNIPVTSVLAKLYDISTGGCGLESPYLLPPETLLRIEINRAPLGAGKGEGAESPISATGMVRSCVMKSLGHYRIGIRFTEIKKEDADYIDSFVKANDQRKAQRWNMPE